MPPKTKKTFKKEKFFDSLEPWLKRLLLVSAAFLGLVILSTAVFFFFYFRSDANKVRVEIEGPDKVFRGVPFEINVKVTNDSGGLLSGAELIVSPSSKIANLNGLEGSPIVSDDLGDMGGGTLTRRAYRFLPLAEVGAKEKVEFKLAYFGAGRNWFEVNKTHVVEIDRESVVIEVKKPDQILPSSAFEFTIDYKNVSDFNFPEVVLEADYPVGFKFVSADLTPDSLNNYWRLGELKALSNGKLEIRGILEKSEETSLVLPLTFSVRFQGKSYPIAEQKLDLAVAPPPVALNILVNRQPNYFARIGDILTYVIQYENLSGIALTDVSLKAELTSELFDFTTLATNARVSLGRMLEWDAENIPTLRLLDAGGKGEVIFSIKLKDQFPIVRLNDKNFSLRLKTEIRSPSVPYYLKADETKVTTSFETKVSGETKVDAQAFYRDASAGVVNNGEMPPKVGAPTQYSIHWLIRNYSTDIKEVTLRTVLQEGVRWTGFVKSNNDSVPLYNEATKEVLWKIDKIRATKGVLDAPLEAVFQIEATPAPSDLGKFQTLTDETVLRAIDEFTGLELLVSDVAINSSLPDDITVGQAGGRVTQ